MPRQVIQLQNTAPANFNAEKNRLFETFYKEHYPFAYGYLRRVLQNTDDAYDVLVHSFELALERFDDYLGSQNKRYWFFGIIRNSASYFLRKRAQDYDVTAGARSRAIPVPRAAATPEELMLAGEEALLIDQVIKALPEKYREVAMLRFQDFSFKEIAASLGLTVEAVESRMRRAITKLEPIYAKYKEAGR